MKIFLINIPRKDVSESGEQINAVPPLGLAYISSILKKGKHEVQLIDAFALRLSVDDIVKKCLQEKPDVIGITLLTPWVADGAALVNSIKRHLPDTIVIAGGPHPTTLWQDTLQRDLADICIIGEGEKTIEPLLEAIANKDGLDKVAGIAWKRSGEITLNARTAFIDDLDSLPFPDWDSLPVENYWDPLMTQKNYARVFASRGCPHGCVFCDQKNIHGRKIRKRSPGNVADELEYLLKEKQVRDIDINDSEFTFYKEWVQEICEEILKRGLVFSWRCNGRADSVDRKTLTLMKRSGCRMVSLGVESGDDDILKKIRKGETTEEIRRGCKLIKEAKIKLDASFMLGLPFETRETMNKTINFARELDPDYAHFAIAIPYPGTEFYQIAMQEGFPVPDDWARFSFYGNAVYAPPGLSVGDVREAYIKAVKEFYVRPKYLLKQLVSVRSVTNLKMVVRGGWNVLKRI